MNNKTLTSRIIATSAMVLLTCLLAFASTSTLPVYPGSWQGWKIRILPQAASSAQPNVTFVSASGSPSGNLGSLEFRIDADGELRAELFHSAYAGIRLPNPKALRSKLVGKEISDLSYSTYIRQFGPIAKAPHLILNVDNNKDGTADDQLVFDPARQNGSFAGDAIPNQCENNSECLSLNKWQTWDALNGGWQSRAGADAETRLFTLKSYRAAHPDARIVNPPNSGGVQLVAGGGAGEWENFAGSVGEFNIGVADSNTSYRFQQAAQAALATTGLIISEFRVSGPNGPTDEFVELYNTTDDLLIVQASDSSGGWSIAKTNEPCGLTHTIVAVIPNGTTIPAQGHLLVAGAGYSLGSYPAGTTDDGTALTTATPDLPLTNIEPARSIGLFNSANEQNFNLNSRLDAVGLNQRPGDSCNLLREGTPLPRVAGTTEYSVVRRIGTNGLPQDTNNNAADFVIVSTTPGQSVGDVELPVLGAPGPENLSSAVHHNSGFDASLFDPMALSTAPPNLERSNVPVRCGAFGTITFRRRFTNNTQGLIRRLRFRVMDITTINSPPVYVNQAQVRVMNSPDERILVGADMRRVQGLRRETPPSQPAPRCGGHNTSLNPGGLLLNPLRPGRSINVAFRIGIHRHGSFRFFVVYEVLP
jgi:hypothetical protein